jgi:hypothetical protein
MSHTITQHTHARACAHTPTYSNTGQTRRAVRKAALTAHILKSLYSATLLRKYTRALTFENLWKACESWFALAAKLERVVSVEVGPELCAQLLAALNELLADQV